MLEFLSRNAALLNKNKAQEEEIRHLVSRVAELEQTVIDATKRLRELETKLSVEEISVLADRIGDKMVDAADLLDQARQEARDLVQLTQTWNR